MKVAVPAASLIVTSSIENAGGASLSVIVAVPVAFAFVVVPAVTVALRVKFSSPSLTTSSVIGVRTSTLVLPAAIVAFAAGVHVAPPSIDTSRPGPKSTPPPVAEPFARARFTLTGVVETLLRLTVKIANGLVPSVTLGLLTLSVGVSLSDPPVPVPSSLIVPSPRLSAIVAFTAPLRFTLKVSLPS